MFANNTVTIIVMCVYFYIDKICKVRIIYMCTVTCVDTIKLCMHWFVEKIHMKSTHM